MRLRAPNKSIKQLSILYIEIEIYSMWVCVCVEYVIEEQVVYSMRLNKLFCSPL